MTGKKPGLRARSDAVKAALAADLEGAAPAVEGQAAVEPERKKPVALSVRLPPELHEELRTIAFERRVSIHALLMEGVEAVVKKYRKR